MRKYNYIYKFVLTLILLSLLWVSILFLIISLPKQKDPLKRFLPNDIDMAISVNMHKLLSTLFIDAIYKTDFNSKDLKLLENKDFAEKDLFKGIDFNSEIVFFYDSWEGHIVKGLLFNLADSKSFNKIHSQEKNVVKESNEQRGVIIYLDDDSPKEIIDHYTVFAKKVISKKPVLSASLPPTGVMNLSFTGNKFSYIQDLALKIHLKDEHLLIKGSGELNSIPPLKQIYMLKEPADKKYFEIQSGKLPDSVFKYVDKLAKQLDIEIPETSSQQILIYGISIDKMNSALIILPKMDCIIRFDSIVHLDTLLKNMNKDFTHVNFVDNYLEIGEIKYYYKQLSKNEIYFGVTKSPEIQNIKTRVLPLTKGFPSVILDIEGKGIIVKIINMMPQVKNVKSFLKGVKYFDIHSDYVDDNHLKIKGEVRLEKGEMISVGLAEFILEFFK